MSHQKSAKELHKQVIGKFEKRRVYFSFKDNIWGVDLVNMQLISNRNKRIQCCLICYWFFNKYTWVVPLKDNKSTAITNVSQTNW